MHRANNFAHRQISKQAGTLGDHKPADIGLRLFLNFTTFIAISEILYYSEVYESSKTKKL